MTAMTATIDMPHTKEPLEPVNADSSAIVQPDVVADLNYSTADEAPLAEAPSAGKLLREARAASGMHIATLSMALKVPVKKLEALEADDWTTLPDPVFVRALATSVCRHIKTNSAPILALLPKIPNPMMMDETAAKGLNQRFVAATDPKPSLLRLPVSVPMMLGALVFLLAALVLMFLPEMVQRTAAKKTEVVEVAALATVFPPQEVSSAPMAPIEAASNFAPAVTSTSTPASASIGPLVPPSIAPVTTPSPLPSLAVASAVAPVKQALTQPNLTPSTLRMVAKGVVWVEVKDAKGGLLVQRTLQPKEAVNVSGQAPLAVVVGRINEMESIDVRGKPFSLAGLSPDNVARFEVK